MTQVTVTCHACENLMGVPADEKNDGHVCASCIAFLLEATKIKALKVVWIPQVPMRAFEVAVESPEEGAKLLGVLADYDLFQYENNIKGDYCNAGDLLEFLPDDKTDSPEGSWVTWYDPETDEDIREWQESKRQSNESA